MPLSTNDNMWNSQASTWIIDIVLGGITISCLSYNGIKRPRELETRETYDFNMVHRLIVH